MKTRASLWGHYLLLMAVEEAFKNLKGDLAVRPVFHQLEARIVSTIFATTVRRSRKGAREHSRARRRIGARSFTRIVPAEAAATGCLRSSSVGFANRRWPAPAPEARMRPWSSRAARRYVSECTLPRIGQ